MAQPTSRIPKPLLFNNSRTTTTNRKSTSHTIQHNQQCDEPTEQPKGLFSLPIELRMRIYILVLRPDCNLNKAIYCNKPHVHHHEKSLGCTKLLSVCSQMYSDCIELFHWFGNGIQLTLDGRYRRVLRKPLEFGKPGYFIMSRATTACYVPREYDALQVVRMRKLILDICCLLPIADVAANIEEVSNVVAKSKSLQMLRIKFQPGDSVRSDEWPGELEKCKDALMPIVKAAQKTDCELLIEDISLRRTYNDLPWDNVNKQAKALIEWMVATAEASGVRTRFFDDRTEAKEAFANSIAWRPFNKECDNDDSDDEENPEILKQDREFIPIETYPYELTPECHHCNALFRDWSDLKNHLTALPSHKEKYKRKHCNTINPRAKHGSQPRRCWTCGKDYDSLKSLNEHLNKEGHRRHGIIPKYREDNEEWDEKWRKHEARFGWL